MGFDSSLPPREGHCGLWVTCSTPAARAAQSQPRAASGLPVELYLRELLLLKRIAVVSVCKTAFALPSAIGAGVHVGYLPGGLVGRDEQQLPVEVDLCLQRENAH